MTTYTLTFYPERTIRKLRVGLRRDPLFHRALIFCCAFLFAALPFGLIAGNNVAQHYLSNKAFAAMDAHMITDLPATQKERYGRMVKGSISRSADSLLDMKAAAVVLAFAEPQLARRDGDISIWQYRTKDCVLDVFLKNSAGNADSVVHYEMRPRSKTGLHKAGAYVSGGESSESVCFKSLLREQQFAAR